MFMANMATLRAKRHMQQVLNVYVDSKKQSQDPQCQLLQRYQDLVDPSSL